MALIAKGVGKRFDQGSEVLSDISIEVKSGELVSLTGRSGSGKSTLLYLLSSLDTPTTGTVQMSGQDFQKMNSKELHQFRNEKMGFVFQFHYLIAELTTLENVLMPTLKCGQRERRLPYALSLLKQFGLNEKIHRLPRQLSGGEQQRVAIARALVMEPDFLFADEPTGSLDSVNGETVMNIICAVNKNRKTTVVFVTHDVDFANLADRQIKLVDGRVVP